MLTKRIVACLDVRDGRVVKGQQFTQLQDISAPEELATFYNQEGVDELVFYDITASHEQRGIFLSVLQRVAQRVFIPLTVGGGISNLADFDAVLSCGADKVSVNSSALTNPTLITEAAKRYGSQCVVLSMDVKRMGNQWIVFAHGGRKNTGLDAIVWAQKAEQLGAGELVINSIDTDGVKQGFDLPLLRAIEQQVSIPIVASGGAGDASHFLDLFQQLPGVGAGLAASIFHHQQLKINTLKTYLQQHGIAVRLA